MCKYQQEWAESCPSKSPTNILNWADGYDTFLAGFHISPLKRSQLLMKQDFTAAFSYMIFFKL